MTSEIKPCGNCGHSNEHTSPVGTIADMCDEPECICCYYVPAEVPAAREEIRTTRIKVLEECFKIASDHSREFIDAWPIAVGIKRLIDKERASNVRD